MADKNISEEMINKLREQGSNIWKEILNESSSKKEPDEANIFIFGDKDTGKKSLIRTMNKEAGPQDFESKNAANTEENLPLYGLMNYSHLTAKKLLDDDTEINKVGVWMMNELIDKETFLSLVKPKNILKLRKWSDFIYDIFGKLIIKFPFDVQTQIRKQSKKIFFNNICLINSIYKNS